MYNLDINFLKDRGLDTKSKETLTQKPKESAGSKIPLVAGIATMVILPLIGLGVLALAKQQEAQLKSEIKQLEAEISQLQAQNNQIQTMQTQLEATRARRQALVSVFNQIKPMSVLLQDISDQTPPGVQINSIQQNEGKSIDPSSPPTIQLSINGIARSSNDVNDFLLVLQNSDFLDPSKTFIQNVQMVNNPNALEFPDGNKPDNVTIELPKVAQYTITTEVNQVPASELLQQLDNKGAIGLVTRIKTLKEKGAIEP